MVANVTRQIEFALDKFKGYREGVDPPHADLEIDVRLGEHRFTDTVRWFPLDPVQMIDAFALQTVEDLDLPVAMADMISQQMRAQCAEANARALGQG